MRILLLGILFFLFITKSNAGQFDYQCTVVDASDVGDKGEMRNRKDMLSKKLSFMVDRASGTIVGAPFGNASAAKANITVLDAGSKQQAYKVLTVYKPHVLVDYLQVQEFVDGVDKPFFGISFGVFVTGVCR